MQLPIAITMGDAAGIGPEIIAKAYQLQPALLQCCFVWGDVATMRRAAALVGKGVPYPVAQIRSAAEALDLPPHCMAVLQEGEPLAQVVWGQVSATAGAFAGHCVLAAARAAMRGEVAALVTAPLHKEALALALGLEAAG